MINKSLRLRKQVSINHQKTIHCSWEEFQMGRFVLPLNYNSLAVLYLDGFFREELSNENSFNLAFQGNFFRLTTRRQRSPSLLIILAMLCSKANHLEKHFYLFRLFLGRNSSDVYRIPTSYELNMNFHLRNCKIAFLRTKKRLVAMTSPFPIETNHLRLAAYWPPFFLMISSWMLLGTAE